MPTLTSLIPRSSKSQLVQHAERELALAGVEPDVRKWCLDTVKSFSGQGHSGASAFVAIQILTRLLSFEALTPLTADPREWIQHSPDMWDGESGVWQNVRDGRAFSSDGGKTYTYVDDEQRTLHTSVVQDA